jgi:hypothetical protein
MRQCIAEFEQSHLGEMRRSGLARVPPLRKAALRIGVDQRHRTDARAVGLDREMSRQGRLARAALLRRHHQHMHETSPRAVGPL